MTSKQRAYLRGLANTMEPILHIGKDGVTPMVSQQAWDALEARELIKVALQRNAPYESAREACGILCEAGMDFESGQLEYAVVGIGVNTAPAEFPEELQTIATSVGNACGHDISKNQLIAEICGCMEELYAQLADGGFMAESRARSNVIGRQIVVLRGDERIPARAVDIDDQGSLVVETERGMEIVRSGEVSVRWED